MLLQRQIPSIRPLTTAHLAQTMTLLELSAVELRQKVESELSQNPALELVEESRCPTCRRLLYGARNCPICSCSPGSTIKDPIVFLSSRKDFFSPKISSRSNSDEYSDENITPEIEDLPHYVLHQIAPELDPSDRPIAAHILTSLDDDGLLAISPLEIAMYHHVLPSRVEQVLRLIQHADPLGVGSPTPQEALLIQLEVLAENRPTPPLAIKAIQAGFDLLCHHRYPELGRVLHVSFSEAKEIVRFISDNLNPFPARAHYGEVSKHKSNSENTAPTYHFPDVIISTLNDKEDTPLVVEVAMPFYGTLRVNPLFKASISAAPDEKSNLWKSDLEQAMLLVKCIQQRNNTIVRLMQKLAVIQREFILKGESHLQPITRASLAKELDVHESTISRAVSSKTVQLPNSRIVPVAIFFDRSLHIRTALKEIINAEKSPLNDSELVTLLSKKGYKVARRTVAKYRAMEGILPAHLRNYS
jgi:RNA polymerase sigma-54 factor